AINRNFKNGQGEQEADFINCVVWRKPAENVANFLRKGSLAGVDGRIQTRNYEGQDGKRVYVTEVVAESVQFLEPKGAPISNNSQYGGNQSYSQRKAPETTQNASSDPFASNEKTFDVSDDDLPF
ncbi:TPA_asm: single-stranded DNA-binding protein, partial [Listeria monocytogenes]|nr:single-stranded DNA-binding protein [Listeria monocytogenes]